MKARVSALLATAAATVLVAAAGGGSLWKSEPYTAENFPYEATTMGGFFARTANSGIHKDEAAARNFLSRSKVPETVDLIVTLDKIQKARTGRGEVLKDPGVIKDFNDNRSKSGETADKITILYYFRESITGALNSAYDRDLYPGTPSDFQRAAAALGGMFYRTDANAYDIMDLRRVYANYFGNTGLTDQKMVALKNHDGTSTSMLALLETVYRPIVTANRVPPSNQPGG